MIKQQQLLMKTEDIDLVFTSEAIHELAAVAAEVNRSVDNIGARRLHTVHAHAFILKSFPLYSRVPGVGIWMMCFICSK
jgi:ATP-dependent protease HslVU (ClpYQ) ATPase subunit